MSLPEKPGAEAVATKGWLAAHKWLILRRISQLSILALFMIGPLFSIWIVKGNLAASMTLDVLPLTDPYVLLQSVLAGQQPELLGIVGAVIVVALYMIVGGRAYCSWVCPVNIVTDAANWLRERVGIKGGSNVSRSTRYWILAATLVLPLVTGSIVWEFINPVSMLHRGLIFGMGLGWLLIIAIFLMDLLISRRAWCGHYCPVGAFYSALGTHSLVRIRADNRSACDDCMDCFVVCPEAQVIRPALKGEEKGIGPVIQSPNCTNCGRCIDVCAKDVFHFGSRFNNQTPVPETKRHSPKVEVL